MVVVNGEGEIDLEIPTIFLEAENATIGYIRYIRENYDDLALMTYFVEGNPSEVVKSRIQWDKDDETYSLFPVNITRSLRSDGCGNGSNPLKVIWSTIFPCQELPEKYIGALENAWAVPRFRILGRREIFFAWLLEEMEANRIEADEVYQYWFNIFGNPEEYKDFTRCPDAEGYPPESEW